MRKLLAVPLLLGLVGSSLQAQDRFEKPRRSGYFFVAPGAVSVNVNSQSTLQVGGGFEGFLYRGLGIGIDAGALRVSSSTAARRWTGMLSLDAIYDFQRTTGQKFCPFVAAGFTAIPEFDVGGGYNFGGGFKYWFGERYGLRVEFRDHARPGDLHTYNDVQVRIGLAIR